MTFDNADNRCRLPVMALLRFLVAADAVDSRKQFRFG